MSRPAAGTKSSRVAQRVGVLLGVVGLAVAAWVITRGDDGSSSSSNPEAADVVAADSAPNLVAATTTTTSADGAPVTVVRPITQPVLRGEPGDVRVALSKTFELADGERITVGGDGFAQNDSIGVVTCLEGAVGAEFCDLGTVVLVQADKSGTISTPYTVQRFIAVGNEAVDCAARACEIAAGAAQDNSRSATAPLQFTPDGQPADLPLIEVDRVEVADGDAITVTGTDFTAGQSAYLVQCVLGDVDGPNAIPNCFSAQVRTDFVVAGDGSFTHEWQAQRLLPTNLGVVDCAAPPEAARCVLMGNVSSDTPNSRTTSRFTPAIELAFADE